MVNDNKTTAFDDKQYANAYPDGVADHYWHLARNDIIADSLTDEAYNDAVVLEVGCGRGFVVNSLRMRGFDVYGVELANVEVTHQAERFVTVATDALELPISFRESVSVVLLLDVIEHIADPISFLRSLKIAYPRLAKVVVTVPARQEIWSNFDDYFGHFRRYDLESSRALVREVEGELVTVRYFFHVLYFSALLVRLLRLKRGVKLAGPSTRRGRIVNRIIAKIFGYEYKLALRRLPGSSLLVVFKW